MGRLIMEDGGRRQHRDHLRTLREESTGMVRVASAYVTDRSLLVGMPSRQVRLLTALAPLDIASGATSLQALGVLLDAGVTCRFLSGRPRLHAKVYIYGEQAAVVTSANLTSSALDDNLEVGAGLSGPEVNRLTAWFDGMWAQAAPMTPELLRRLREETAGLRSDFARLKKKAAFRVALPQRSSSPSVVSGDLYDLLERAEQFFVCNSNRRHSARTASGGFADEDAMYARGVAAAWEEFNYPGHMQRVRSGAAIFMFAKNVGIIGVGRATARCETLARDDKRTIQHGEIEWRVPVDWLAWRDDADACEYKSNNCTFWDATDAKYAALRQAVRTHFLGISAPTRGRLGD